MEELGEIRGLCQGVGPWCVGEDFNVVMFPSKRLRGASISSTMKRFSKVIDDLELM